MSLKKAFTLVEVLLVVVIISILAAIVIIAMNPARKSAQTNNLQRKTDVTEIAGAISAYKVEHQNALPSAITTTETKMASGSGNVDICSDLVPKYFPVMSHDPTAAGAKWVSCADYDTGYFVKKDADGRVTVNAPNAELSETISVTR